MSTRKNILSKRSNTSYSLRKGGFISFSKKNQFLNIIKVSLKAYQKSILPKSYQFQS